MLAGGGLRQRHLVGKLSTSLSGQATGAENLVISGVCISPPSRPFKAGTSGALLSMGLQSGSWGPACDLTRPVGLELQTGPP